MTSPVHITSEVAASLSAAGIGTLFHKRLLSEESPLGLAYDKWVRSKGPALLKEGGLVVFHGRNQHNELRLVARLFHLNGAGVRIKSLSQTIMTLKRGGEQREEMDDAPVLFLSPAQAGRRLCPLTPWDQEVIADYVKTRCERGQIVLMHWDTERAIDEADPMYQWWDEGFVDWILSAGQVLTVAAMLSTIKGDE